MNKKSRVATKFLLSTVLCFSIAGISYAQNYDYNSNYGNSYSPSYTPQQQTQYSQNYNPQYQQPAYPQSYAQPYAQPVNAVPLQGRVVTVPMGTVLPATSSTRDITSEYLNVGDTVSVNLNSDFFFNGALIAPRGSVVQGDVVVAEKAGRAGKHGKLKVKFTNIRTPMGQVIPISGKIVTEDGSGMLVGGTTKQRVTKVAKDTAVGTGLGALSGVVFGSLAGGEVGKGAALGSAVGGGLGLAKAGIQKGKNAIIASGERIDIKLDQPLTVGNNSDQSQGYNMNSVPTMNQLPGLNY